ncbi:MAG: hypothetical protein FWF79_07200 [Defluviitaleaceae bacterium]|nr:hypothetical protein [Defluviitaleaceae bacterium]
MTNEHPTVYVFIGEVSGVSCESLANAKTAFCIKMGSSAPAEQQDLLIRGIKARIQSNERGLNIKRVFVYAVADATCCAKQVEVLSERLKTLFREDFSSVRLTLAVLLNESNGDGFFEERTVATRNFLITIEKTETFDCIFLLSNRNENGEVRMFSQKNNSAILAALPVINSTESHLYEILAARSRMRGKTLFASAGFWQESASDKNIINAGFRHLAESFEAELLKAGDTGQSPAFQETIYPPFEACQVNSKKHTTPENLLKISNNVTSVAAKPLKFWELWGRTVKEAEEMLYGKEVERFFRRVYPECEKNFMNPFVPKACQKYEAKSKSLKHAISEEEYLRKIISETEQKIANISAEVKHKESSICRCWPWRGVDYVKDIIGELYVLHFLLNQPESAVAELKNRHRHVKSYLDYMRGLIKILKSLPATPDALKETAKTPFDDSSAPLAISLLRDDGLIRERHILTTEDGQSGLLRLIGGFTPQDLTRWNAMEKAISR